ncbi:Glycosyltransferase, GT2 family [Desulfuromusa kysingii]|uniref:Glycosyltransferase, GT2 family n=1 Tax=Desulfuromusa kysingii TaxID=37625 RepID=A0A1H4BA06_9BACT|nr:glycosyltransferase [Desulfuromusa kysingii]SEA44947.1 Glycosyltransferase, GT2 family [Desulfuromusa kysingii]
MIDFSIIIPAKNEEHNIKNCLESIFAVDYDHAQYEVIVVDNGSTDQTVAIAKELGAQTFIQPDLTISGLRNYGASEAKGEIFVFLDADCTVTNSWLAAASRYLKQSEIVSFGSPVVLPPNATWVQKTWFYIREKKKDVEEVEWHESANVFVQREAFIAVHGFDEDLITCEDYDLSFRLSKIGKLLSDRRIIAIHHREPATISEFFKKEIWRSKSNVHRLLDRTFNLRELPSILVPPFYCFLAGLFVLFLLLFGSFDVKTINSGWLILLVVWQLPIVLLSSWKIRHAWNTKMAGQLFVLLNVYFLARGLAFVSELRSLKVGKT